MASLVTRRLTLHPIRLLKAIPLFLLTLAVNPESNLKSSLNRKLVTLALKGLTDEEYGLLAVETGRNLAAKPGFTNNHMLTLCQNSAARSRTIVVTASERRLARAFLDQAGFHGIELIASELGHHEQTLTLATHNVGAAKLARLTKAGIDVARATFYTDSAADISLAVAAAKTYVVNPGPRSRRRLPATVPGMVTMHCQ